MQTALIGALLFFPLSITITNNAPGATRARRLTFWLLPTTREADPHPVHTITRGRIITPPIPRSSHPQRHRHGLSRGAPIPFFPWHGLLQGAKLLRRGTDDGGLFSEGSTLGSLSIVASPRLQSWGRGPWPVGGGPAGSFAATAGEKGGHGEGGFLFSGWLVL